jgi:hypothetical protein
VVLPVKLEMRAKSVFRPFFIPQLFYQKTREFKKFSGHPKRKWPICATNIRYKFQTGKSSRFNKTELALSRN